MFYQRTDRQATRARAEDEIKDDWYKMRLALGILLQGLASSKK